MEKSKLSTILFSGIALAFFTISAYAVPPKVAKTVPESGDQNVDPSLRQIRIEFDQDMSQGGYSVCGGGPKYPKTIGKPKWVNKRTLAIRVKLQPNHEYELSVNCQSYRNFKNLQGESAVIYPIKFKTTIAGEKSSTSTKSPSLLLQEGLYAEETEGDLEKAINLYEQVIDEAGEIQRLAAKATYQLGMCYLKKGKEQKAAEYFQQVVSNYQTQNVLVKKASIQLEKVSSVKDIIARSYVIHYKAIDQSQDALKLLNKDHPKGVRTHHANRYRENGETIDSICTNTEEGKDKIVAVIEDSDELKLVKVVPPMGQTKFPEFEGCKIKETVKLKLDKPEYEWWLKEPYISKTIYENSKMEIEWDLDSIIGEKVKSFAVGVLPIDTDVSDIDSHMWWANRLAFTVRKTPYGKEWSDWSTKSKTLKPGNYRTYICALDSDENLVWRAMLDKHTIAVSTATLIIKVMPYTQVSINDIQPDGTIKMKNIIQEKNTGGTPITTKGFINSDFVHVEKMFDDKDRPIKFTTKHENDIFRYHLTFNEPVMPDEAMLYSSEGTITGLVKPLTGSKDEYQYYMRHHPGTNVPTRRIEVFKLPEGAELISTTPTDMARREKDGRIELFVEEIVPPGGSITTAFQYKLAGARLASAEPLKLDPAPWIDGEVMELRLKRPTGREYGTIIYSAKSNTLDGNNMWQIISHMYVTEGSLSQYTFVEADADSFAPIYGQTTNWMGDFVAEYNEENVRLTVDTQGKESTRDVPIKGIAYDNEQALYLIRRMPLAENYEGSFPIFSVQGGTRIECRIKVLGTEEVTVEAGTFTCYKTDLSIYAGNLRTLQHTLWFSADKHKYLVKYDVGGTATMELAEVWQKDKNKPLAFDDEESYFTVSVPTDWRLYNYGSGQQSSLQLIPPEVKAWAVLVWQKRGTDPDSASVMTIAKADCEKLKGFFENYTTVETSWKEYKINGLEAAQYLATYREKGNPLRKYTKPKQMVEYRTYLVDESNVYWFVFRIEEDEFLENKAEFDSIVNGFKANAK